MTHNTQIYDTKCFFCKDIYLDALLFSVIHFVLLFGRPVLMKMEKDAKKWSNSLNSSFI